MNILARISIAIGILFCLIVIILMLLGTIAFGHGLGDLYNLIQLCVIVLCLSAVYFFSRNFDFNNHKFISISISCIVCFIVIHTVYEFTLGRGGEYGWNGHIFK